MLLLICVHESILAAAVYYNIIFIAVIVFVSRIFVMFSRGTTIHVDCGFFRSSWTSITIVCLMKFACLNNGLRNRPVLLVFCLFVYRVCSLAFHYAKPQYLICLIERDGTKAVSSKNAQANLASSYEACSCIAKKMKINENEYCIRYEWTQVSEVVCVCI